MPMPHQPPRGSARGSAVSCAPAGETIPDLPAGEFKAEQDSAVADDSPTAASEVVEEYIEK